MTQVGIYTYGRTDIPLPTFGTDYASCFDLSYFPTTDTIHGYDRLNQRTSISILPIDQSFLFPPLARLLIPTGMIFDLPEGHDMRVHPRSGVSIKQGLTLINAEGVIDEDYTNEIFIPLINHSMESIVIRQGDRLAQAEICTVRQKTVGSWTEFPWCRIPRPEFFRLPNAPDKKGNRFGGFGSTGTNTKKE
jgi:deoxyuridine 5'-triphosphate nucleotidohydrolase